ncbi:unnamed protein product [Choristocarpus tenellus]
MMTEEDILSSTESNIYGLMRSPWNTNNVPYLTRALGKMCGIEENLFSWPSCEDHYDLLMDNDNLYDFTWGSMYEPHGAVHSWIGGDFGCAKMYDTIEELVGERLALDLRPLASMHRKNAWRYDIFKCRGTAGLEIPQEEVMTGNNDKAVCGCLDYDLSKDEDVLELVKTFVFLEDMLHHM